MGLPVTTPSNSKFGFWRHFLPIFLPVALAILVLLGYLYRQAQEASLLEIKNEERLHIETGAQFLVKDLRVVKGDVLLVAGLDSLKRAIETPSPENLERLAGDFTTLSQGRSVYDQVRWLDETGRERVRVNFQAGKAYAVPEEQLQDKHARYYFIATQKLRAGVLYISDFDLNVENGRLEIPHKPTLRLATPVFDQAGTRRGIVIINYLGKHLLDSLAADIYTDVPQGKHLLLNQDGYWLRSPRPEEEWGFMLGRKETFGNRHPEVWMRMRATAQGQVLDDSGLWSFITIRPENSGDEATGSDLAAAADSASGNATGYWKAVSWIPTRELDRLTAASARSWLILGTVFMAFVAIISGRLAVDQQRRKLAETTLRDLNRSLERQVEERTQRLRQQEAKFHALVDNSPEGILFTDGLGNISFASNQALSILGFGQESMVLGRHILGFAAPDHMEKAKAYLGALYADEAHGPFMFEATREDASRIWLEINGDVQFGKEGDITDMVFLIRDISGRKRGEQELKDAEQRFHTLVANIPGMVYRCELHAPWRLFYVSEGCESLTGNTAETFLNPQHPLEYINIILEEDRPEVERAVEEAIRLQRHYHMDYRIRRADGNLRWVHERGRAHYETDGTPAHLDGVILDITERKQAEQAIQLANKRLEDSYGALQAYSLDLARINEMNELLQSCQDASEAYQVVGQAAHNLRLGTGGALAVVTQRGHYLETVANWGDGAGMSDRFELEQCWSLRKGQRHAVFDMDKGPHCSHFQDRPDTPYICTPMTSQGENIGLITVRFRPDTLQEELLRVRQLVTTLSDSLKLALHNIRLREDLHEQATRDPLTGLYNRRYLDETLPRELHRCLREGIPLALAMLDIDHFKRFNDTWGHEAGDLALVEVARILRENLRASDIACRYGGEELVAVMPGADQQEARERIEKIAARMRSMDLSIHDQNLPPITFSAGLAFTPENGDGADALIHAADQALYAAKAAGRDRIILAG